MTHKPNLEDTIQQKRNKNKYTAQKQLQQLIDIEKRKQKEENNQ